MQESEAKKKICPKLAAGMLASNVTQIDALEKFSLCKGSKCMMWEADKRLETVEKEVKHDNDYTNYIKSAPDGYGFQGINQKAKTTTDKNVVAIFSRYVDDSSGDCGLKPVCYGGECKL